MKLLAGILLFIVAQSMIWFQSNGQFIWPWFKKNTLLISLLTGTSVSYIVIYGTRLMVDHFGALWPGRFIGFSVGMVVFAVLTWAFMEEGINLKTAVSLCLAMALLAVQLFWK